MGQAKNRANRRKHGLDLADAEEMFRGPIIVRPDMREDYGEERWVGIGATLGRVAVVSFVLRREETIRVISLRKANREEYKEYEEALED